MQLLVSHWVENVFNYTFCSKDVLRWLRSASFKKLMIYSYDKIEAEKFIMMDAHKYINAD